MVILNVKILKKSKIPNVTKRTLTFFKMSWIRDMCALSTNKTQTDWLPCTNRFNQPENVFLVLLSHRYTSCNSSTVKKKNYFCQLILMDHPSFFKTFGQVRTIMFLLFFVGIQSMFGFPFSIFKITTLFITVLPSNRKTFWFNYYPQLC